MAPRAPDISTLLPITHHRLYLEPIGPPTELVQPAQFVDQAQKALDRAKARVDELEQRLQDSGVAEQVRQRCSLSPLRNLLSTTHSDIIAREELRQWHEARLLPLTGGRGFGGGVEDDEGDEQEGEGEGARDVGEQVRKVRKVGEMVQEAEESELRLLKSLDLSHYLRKHKLHDTNILQNMLPPAPPSVSLLSPSTPSAPLDSLLYTLTFHPIPTLAGRSPFSVKKQVMLVLGSNTLEEVRTALRKGGEGVPTFEEEEEGEGEEESESESESEEDEEEEERSGSPGVLGKRRGVWAKKKGEEEGDGKKGKGKGKRRKKVKWGEERRRTGCCFGVEGVLYPDGEDDVEDYADTILHSLSLLPRSLPRHLRSPSTELLPIPTPLSPPFSPTSRAAHLAQTCNPDPNTIHPWLPPPPAAEGEDGGGGGGATWKDVEWRKGGSVQETRVGEVAMRVGEPYWFVHQGSAEHVWSVESIRLLHPLDPPPSCYPLTTHLSRLLHPKCRLCDRDPSSLVTLDDELAGENPAWLCRRCFVCLHGDERGARERGVGVVRIFGE